MKNIQFKKRFTEIYNRVNELGLDEESMYELGKALGHTAGILTGRTEAEYKAFKTMVVSALGCLDVSFELMWGIYNSFNPTKTKLAKIGRDIEKTVAKTYYREWAQKLKLEDMICNFFLAIDEERIRKSEEKALMPL